AELPAEDFGQQMNPAMWPELKQKLAAVIKQKSRDEWTALMEGTDVCFAPVLSLEEAPSHPHNVARGSFVTVGNTVQPAPTPRFSRSAAGDIKAAASAGADSQAVLRQAGFSDEQIDTLIS
ncbi:MAG TPA: carnitine dehydratase, partial [Alcanivorax sp.]|nr:carnitine dehydratase [Alcanivorax sp.]